MTGYAPVFFSALKRKDREMQEIWKDIEGFEGLYQISSLGRLRSLDRKIKCGHGSFRTIQGTLIKLVPNPTNGYIQTSLWKDRKATPKYIHRLVAKHFIDNPLNKKEVNHLNENKLDNRVENLEWVTRCENENYGTKRQRANQTRSLKQKEISRKISIANSIPIIQIDLDGNVVKKWESASQILNEYGYVSETIVKRCKTNSEKPIMGCIWKYADKTSRSDTAFFNT